MEQLIPIKDLVARVQSYNPRTDVKKLRAAYDYAKKAHAGQRRRSGEPYFTHPVAVAALLAEQRLDDATIITALLHDTVEDTATTRDELRRIFSPRIARIVAEVTDNKRLKKATRKRMQIKRAGRASQEARYVKLADKICNLRDILRRPPAGWDVKRRREYFDWSKRVVDRLRGTSSRLEARFDAVYRRKP